MTQEYKTLRELDVQPGDVVELQGYGRVNVASISDETMIDYTARGWLLDGGEWRIVSRASYTPKLLRDMTDAEIGALVRAHHQGKVIEIWDYDEWLEADPAWDATNAYRVRSEPKRETVTLVGGFNAVKTYWHFGDNKAEFGDTRCITFDLIDGNMPAGTYISEDGHTITMEELPL